MHIFRSAANVDNIANFNYENHESSLFSPKNGYFFC